MRGMNSASVDLIYLDPPFNSKANYAAPIGSQAAGAAFKDTWTLSDVDVEWIDLIEGKHPGLYRLLLAAMTDSDKSYLVYMAVRLLEMHRILRPTGSIYLHCDPTMSHYLKVLLDVIFGRENFRNEIIWCYGLGGSSKRFFSRKHDVILFYSKGPEYFFEKPLQDSTSLAMDGRKKGMLDTWTNIPSLNNMARERVGYPTQKPLALLQRIIKASSNEGDMVLDPFCGCATACIASQDEGRRWVGIDISPKAAELVNQRLHDELGMFVRSTHRTDLPNRTDLGVLLRYNHPDNKKRLYGEQSGNCEGCGEHFKMQNLEVDHIIAQKSGGTDHISNLQLLCGNCNRVKGNRGMEYLRNKLQIAA